MEKLFALVDKCARMRKEKRRKGERVQGKNNSGEQEEKEEEQDEYVDTEVRARNKREGKCKKKVINKKDEKEREKLTVENE